MVVFEFCEEMLRRGRYGVVDAFLSECSPAVLEVEEIVAILSITWHGKRDLSRRDEWLARAEDELRRRVGDDRAERLLKNRR